MLSVDVVLREAAMTYDHVYTYLVPEELAADISLGRRVLVPFGSGDRTREAFCWSEPKPLDPEIVASEAKLKKYKPVQAVLDHDAMLREDLVELASQMKMRYACSYGQAIRTMLPAGTQVEVSDWIRLPEGEADVVLPEELVALLADQGEVRLSELQVQGYSRQRVLQWVRDGLLVRGERLHQPVSIRKQQAVRLKEDAELSLAEAYESGLVNSVQQEAVLDVLEHDGAWQITELLDELRIGRSVIKTLERKGLVEVFQQASEVGADTSVKDELASYLSPELSSDQLVDQLTDEQTEALETIVASDAEAGALHEYLLYGITGSGKTEVYIRLVADCLAQGKQAIVLVPEIALTPQTTSRFAVRFGDRLAVLHSRLTSRQRFEEWRKIREGKADLVIGARSAIFAPVEKLGLIVIDEEHEQTYEQDSSPRYSARTIARLRARHHGAKLVLGSATPSVVSYHRTEEGKATRLELNERPSGSRLPEVRIVDLRKDRGSGIAAGIISEQLRLSLQESLDQGEQAMLFLNRRGYASVYLCLDCGEQIHCPDCEVKLTWHRARGRLICHYCGFMTAAPERCPSCFTGEMSWQGFGTEQVENCCHTLFPEARILRMDQDTTTGRQAHWSILQQFREREADLLIGTQMIAKGHDFPYVTTVGILSADQMLAINDYRAGERAFQLMTQAAGRAGRAERPGRVLLQAFDVDDYAVQSAAAHDYLRFYQEEISFRRFLNYPPYGVLGHILLAGTHEIEVRKWAQRMSEHLASVQAARPRLADTTVTEPLPAAMYKLGGRYRMQINLRSKQEAAIAELLHAVRTLVLPRGLTVAYGMDPA